MNVAELIAALEKVEDKTLPVMADGCTQCWNEVVGLDGPWPDDPRLPLIVELVVKH